MSSENSLEQYRIDQKPPAKFTRFVKIVDKTSKIVTREFKAAIPGAHFTSPAVAIFSDTVLDQMAAPALAIPLEQPVYAAYAASKHEIHTSESAATSSDIQRLNLVLAEEFIHAHTRRDFDDHLRIAYNTYPTIISQSRLIPGAIYDFTRAEIPQSDEEQLVIKGDEQTTLLLERATLLAVHLMMDRLLNTSYPLLILKPSDQQQPTALMKNRALLNVVLESMYEGDPNKLPAPILYLFQSPQPIMWASSSLKGGEDEYIGMEL